MKTKTIPAGQFKARCLAIMDEVQAKRQAVVITKRGKPVAKLIAIAADSGSLIGSLKHKVSIKGDILSTGAAWHAER